MRLDYDELRTAPFIESQHVEHIASVFHVYRLLVVLVRIQLNAAQLLSRIIIQSSKT